MLRTYFIAVAVGVAGLSHSGQAECVGDANGNLTVSLGEVQKTVNNYLLSPCVRFIDNGDGTVTDQTTQLMWEKKSAGGGLNFWGNTYTWSSNERPGYPTGTLFAEFLRAMNGGGDACVNWAPDITLVGFTDGFAHHCDWRIPTIMELLAITEEFPCEHPPWCIDPTFGDIPSPQAWSSTAYPTAVGAWANTHPPLLFPLSNLFSARAVRGVARP